jgi:hypothetical protein
MPITFQFFHDSALTQPVTSGNPIAATQASDNSLAAVDKQLWFGSTTASVKAQAASNPGVDAIVISPSDTNGATGLTTSHLKLAATQSALTAATAGASLNIAATVNSGSGSAYTFWVRIDAPAIAAGAYTDLGLTTNELVESAV